MQQQKRKNKMKILLGTHYLAKTGGTENYTYALAMELKRQGYDVEHFAIVKGKTSSLLEEQGIPFMSGEQYDLILANHTTVVEKLWPYGFVIQTCHGTIPELEQPSPYADAYVGVSEEVKEHLQRLGFEATVIPNGIDCKRFCPKKPVSPRLSTVLSLCHSDIANDFVRRCCEQAGLKFIQCNKFKENVWAIEDVINECDLIVGLGRSAYDAMACGRCVLVYDFREHYMNEFLGEGMLTPENIGKAMSCNCTGKASRLKYDEQAFIDEMQKYSPELAAWSREYALKNLNIEEAVRKYFDVYRNVDIRKCFGTCKAHLSKTLDEAYQKLAALCDKEQSHKQIQEQLAEQQRQAASLQTFYEAKSRKHLRAIRGLTLLCIALAIILLMLIFIR